MIKIEELIDPIKIYNPNANLDAIRKAYEYGFKAHESQLRELRNKLIDLLEKFRLQ